jgi:hypothetical protein
MNPLFPKSLIYPPPISLSWMNPLKKYLDAGEGEKLDFKELISSANKIAKTIVSFANTKGGVIIIGVKDNLTLMGITPEEETFMIKLAVNKYCQPIPEVYIETIEYKYMSFLLVEVKEGINKPYFAREKDGKKIAYIRIHDQSVKASGVWLAYQKLKNKPGIHIHMGDEEKNILMNCSTHALRFNELHLATAIPRKKLSALVSRLLYLDLLEIKYTHNEESYATVL